MGTPTLALITMDLDTFKNINDTHSHLAVRRRGLRREKPRRNRVEVANKSLSRDESGQVPMNYQSDHYLQEARRALA
jgi:hypothetical protein